jgi:hypothetical protein
VADTQDWQSLTPGQAGCGRGAELARRSFKGHREEFPMKINKRLLAILALPVVAAAQGAPAKARVDPKASLAVISANVAKVTYAPEKERWQANIAAWRIIVAHPGVLSKDQRDEIKSELGAMALNLSKIRDVGEKERWQANIDLWQLLIADNGVIARGNATWAATLVRKIETNLAKVEDAAEKERWNANVDIWKSVLDRARTIV